MYPGFAHRSYQLPLLAVLAGLSSGFWSCSQYSNGKLNKAYHNTTAHYNAFWIARDRIREAELALFKTRQENYNQLLPIMLPIDSVTTQPVKQQLDDAIKKASIVAERHQNSKWLDNSYNLIGTARLYKQDLPNAIEVFKYVNTKSKDDNDKHTALIGLMRAYIETGDYANGLTVANYLREQSLTKDNTRDFYLTKAYLHQKKSEYAVSAAILEAAFPLLKKGEATARLRLIAGQLYDLANQPGKAAQQFKAVLSAKPTYDQSFYANIYLLQSSGAAGDAKQAARSTETFNNMLTDRKNADLRDKIYYTMGLLEARRGSFDRAIGYYQQSIRATTVNTAQIPYTYLELGKLLFERKKDYPLARMYYDSALGSLPQYLPDYATTQARKKVLDEFVSNQTIIQTEDSLQRLAQMNPAALDKLLDQQIALKEKQAREQLALAEQITGRSTNLALATNSNLQPGERWMLYNPILMTQGKQDFSARWGTRPLEDNWRRANKEASQAQAADNNPINGGTPANSINPSVAITPSAALPGQPGPGTPVGEPVNALKSEKQALFAQIPFTKEALQQSNQRLEDAYYKVGKIYKFQLNQPNEAISTFEALLTRFPNTTYRPEAYYLLHLANEQIPRASTWKDKLQTEFANSSYARLVGRAVASTAQTTGSEAQAQKAYTDLYELYQSGNLTEALARTETALGQYVGAQIEDKMALLRVILVGRVQGPDAYRQALDEFARDYPNSPLLPRVKEFQAAANQPTAKRK
ncbi:MAG: tetratricopeptide repeat protein [Bacteroidetes bacterium]|nr:tetratricopeptide repeat protein [Fibrella sp.]